MASKILAKAIIEEGQYALAIPSFGFERRGAPVTAFLRVDDKEIRTVTNFYHPDNIICIDPSVSRAVDIFKGFQAGGTWVQATKKASMSLRYRIMYPSWDSVTPLVFPSIYSKNRLPTPSCWARSPKPREWYPSIHSRMDWRRRISATPD